MNACNSLAPETFDYELIYIIFKLILIINALGIFGEIAF